MRLGLPLCTLRGGELSYLLFIVKLSVLRVFSWFCAQRLFLQHLGSVIISSRTQRPKRVLGTERGTSGARVALFLLYYGFSP